MLIYIFAAMIALPVIGTIWHLWPVSAEERAHRAHDTWWAERHAAGMSIEEIAEERRIRLAMARLRRIASDKVVCDPRDYHTAVSDAAKAETHRLYSQDRGLARRFGALVHSLNERDILYPDALAAIDALRDTGPAPRKPDPVTLADHEAAFTDL